MKTIRVQTVVPIYNVTLQLSVVRDPVAEVNRLKDFLGKVEWGQYAGACISNGDHFALILRKDKVCALLVAHEVFHLTCRIVRFHNMKLRKNEEAAALLCGYLHSWVVDQIWN